MKIPREFYIGKYVSPKWFPLPPIHDMIDLYSDRWEFAMSQNPDFEETSLFDLFPAEEKKTDKKEQKNEKTENAAPKDGRGKESAVTAVKND